MTTPLSLDTARREDGTLALVATGEIDLSNVAVFAEALNNAVTQPDSTPVTVDLSAVEYLDSGAINVLFDKADDVRVVANPLLIPVLKVSGLADLTSVVPAGAD
ncbi:MAG: STAS domain-containing protein [Mycobacterium sp.]